MCARVQVWKERKKSKNPLERLKKKDEKLEKLKKCTSPERPHLAPAPRLHTLPRTSPAHLLHSSPRPPPDHRCMEMLEDPEKVRAESAPQHVDSAALVVPQIAALAGRGRL